MNFPADFGPSADTKHLRLRAQWIRRLREWFWARGFMEVETPLLSWDTVVDRHLDPIAVSAAEVFGDARDGRKLWLQTSPEFGMKRLLSRDIPAIFQVTRAFRAAERGHLHNVEFTMAEWYRVGDDYQAGMDLLASLATDLLEATECHRLSYREAFLQHSGVDPFELDPIRLRDTCLGVLPAEDVAALNATSPWDRDLTLDLVFTTRVLPNLGVEGPILIHDHPADQAALSRRAERTYGSVAERFELFFRGLELANGYHELLDERELRLRNEQVNQQRQEDGKPTLPVESRLLRAMESGLPSCAGVALGVDRAIMARFGIDRIDQVWAFPIERA